MNLSRLLTLFGLVINTIAAIVALFPLLNTNKNVEDELIEKVDKRGNYTQKKHLKDRRIGIISFFLLALGFVFQIIGLLIVKNIVVTFPAQGIIPVRVHSIIVFIVLLAVGILSSWFYVIKGNEVFEFNSGKGYFYTIHEAKGGKVVSVEKDKRDILNSKDTPQSWRCERFYHRALGVATGFIALLLLLLQNGAFSNKFDFTNLGWPDLILFMTAFIGLNGRLPTIAHSVQEWFKR